MQEFPAEEQGDGLERLVALRRPGVQDEAVVFAQKHAVAGGERGPAVVADDFRPAGADVEQGVLLELLGAADVLPVHPGEDHAGVVDAAESFHGAKIIHFWTFQSIILDFSVKFFCGDCRYFAPQMIDR